MFAAVCPATSSSLGIVVFLLEILDFEVSSPCTVPVSCLTRAVIVAAQVRLLASANRPLRKLTRKGVSCHFGPKQKASFQWLKRSMIAAGTLAYFDISVSTKVIADASPVGLDIYGMRFDLVTDHKPFEVIYGPCSKPSARIDVALEFSRDELRSIV